MEDMQILKEIEEQRTKLNSIANQKSLLTDASVLLESIKLDKLLNKYYSHKCCENN